MIITLDKVARILYIESYIWFSLNLTTSRNTPLNTSKLANSISEKSQISYPDLFHVTLACDDQKYQAHKILKDVLKTQISQSVISGSQISLFCIKAYRFYCKHDKD